MMDHIDLAFHGLNLVIDNEDKKGILSSFSKAMNNVLSGVLRSSSAKSFKYVNILHFNINNYPRI